MVDTGIGWHVAHSGRTIGTTSQFNDMLGQAGRDYDVLVVGYVSRFTRDLRTAVNARHQLHEAGALLQRVRPGELGARGCRGRGP